MSISNKFQIIFNAFLYHINQLVTRGTVDKTVRICVISLLMVWIVSQYVTVQRYNAILSMVVKDIHQNMVKFLNDS